MADLENNKQIRTNQLTMKFVADRNESMTDDRTLSYHRNGLFQSIKSSEIFSVNEPSTLKCVDLPADYLGHVTLSGEKRHLIFCGNSNPNTIDNISEIGLFDEALCLYSKIVRNSCLNFSKYNGPIKGYLRINQDKEEEIIFIDGHNPDRIINISQIPYEYVVDEASNCKTKVYNANLDCDEIRLDPFISFPMLEVTKGGAGELPNGVYSISIAYTINDEKFTDYMSSTVPIMINRDVSGTSSIAVALSNLDRDFDKFQVVLTGTVKGVTSHKVVGLYPTSQSYVVISDWENREYRDIGAEDLVVRKQIYNSTGILAANSKYLFRADVTKKPEVNYQPQAFNIITSYVVKRVPIDYYKNKGNDIGYFRNENYNFMIRWYWGDGEITRHAQIAGREKQDRDKMQATGKDVFENDLTVRTVEAQRNIEYWQAFNTAGSLVKIEDDSDPNEVSAVDEKIIGYGRTGYFESIIHYPDDPDHPKTGQKHPIFGSNACTPIRFHKMPDEEKIPRYWTDPETGEDYIQILGVKFENIEHPKDEDGNYIKGITHYEILRSERDEANSTVVARGIVTNMGEFKDDKGYITAYSNFPHNSLQPNSFLSQKQTWKRHGREYDFQPLNTFSRKRFTFYSPHGNYFGRRSLASSYMHFETEEWGTATGFFEAPHKHPKFKLLSNYSFYLAACIGVIEALSLVIGTRTVTINQSQLPWDMTGLAVGSFNAGTSTTIGSLYPVQSTTTEENRLSFPRFYADLKGTPAALIPVKFLVNTIKLLVALGGFIIEAAKFVSEILETIKNFSEGQQYARQFNSVVLYNNQRKIQRGNKRRAFDKQPFYLDNGIHTTGGIRINNGGRNGGIYINLKYPVPFPRTEDTSRYTMGEAQLRPNSKQNVERVSSVYYTSIMKHNPNQYGSIEGFVPTKIHTNPIIANFNPNRSRNIYESPIMFGGDCIIAEQTNLNKFPVFRQDLTGTDFNNDIAYDYRDYPNVAFPRYWIDGSEYNIGNMMKIIGKAQPSMEKLPNQKHNMDQVDKRTTNKNELIEKDQVFYTSVNGVFRYIVEVPYNIAYRSTEGEGEGAPNMQHYSDENANLSVIFRADNKAKPESFKLDSSYQYLSQIYTASESLVKIPKAPVRERNTVLYSLPSTQSHSYNNWRYFLPLNRFSFDERDWGWLSGIHPLDQDRLLFLFTKTSPLILPGRDMLKLDSGRNVIIGDGGLFAVEPREMMKTHVAYGSNHDRHAFSSNQFGNFYVSEQQGKLFNVTDKLDEFSRNGWHKWCANFIPLQLKRQFPNYKGIHNPLAGVGYQVVFDNFYETVYFCKKDWYATTETLVYDESNDRFMYGNKEIHLGDPDHFEDCSLTLSYCPSMESFVSYHDWHPDGLIQGERHFLAAKGSVIYKHNERMDHFCNFYDKDHPYQIGFTVSTGQTTTVMNSLEWIQEAYIYKTNEMDRYSPFNETFDWAMIFNQEQHSGMLNLIPSTETRQEFRLFPDFISDYQVKVPIKKAEGKWRLNMFYDYTKDRGRLEDYDKQPFITKRNGYDFIINQPYLDFKANNRPPRFRNHWHSVWFSREVCGNIQFITKFNNSQINVSPR